MKRTVAAVLILSFLCLVGAGSTFGRPPIRKAFFDVYTSAEFTRLDDLASNAGHCGVCHLDFNGGGPRNAYGLAVEVAINSGAFTSNEDAIASLAPVDSDNDGFTNVDEVTSILFLNTPTFPGLTAGDTLSVSNVTLSDIVPYLTPFGSTDTIPPVVTVITPSGGESWGAQSTQSVTWTATDANGISFVDIFLSDDAGATYKPVARRETNDGTFAWFVPNRPGGASLVRVTAQDGAGNYGSNVSAGTFTIGGVSGGYVPTTMRDMDLPGSQPLEGVVLDDPDVSCVSCHGNYNTAVEPWYQWKGSMMAQAMRDPLFLACVAVAEQDAPSVGDLCLRCHSPGGWMEGHSVDTSGDMMNAKDRQGVQCDFCHRFVDPVYSPGVSPARDAAVLDSLDIVPPSHANGQFVNDADPLRRGPFADAQASHAFLESPFHRSSDLCGTCHDVSNPVFVAGLTPGDYVPGAFDAPHEDFDLRNMFPVERTYSEWTQSDYANGGVFAPQFAGNKADGIVSSCQDCHMRDVSGKGCNEPGVPVRPDLPQHDLTGANHFVPDIIPDFFPTEVDTARLQAGKQRAIGMLQLAASLALAPGQAGNQPAVTVTVTNETAHKLPSGYPEGRRIWLHLEAWDSGNALVYESGAYNAATGVLTHDDDAKIYEIHPGLSPALGGALGLPAGKSFHFVLNDTIYSDNRIPPRGFTNAAFEAIQSPPVAHTYADGQYWDDTQYVLPTDAAFVRATLYYQSTTKEYIEFLRDENVTNSAGQDLYNAWAAHGRAAPVLMATDTVSVQVIPSDAGKPPVARTELKNAYPNPFNPATTIRYSLAARQPVHIAVYDVSGALVRTLVDEARPAGVQGVTWEGTDANGTRVASGVYLIKMTTQGQRFTRKIVLVK